jgi:hypothetical protein
MLKKKAIDQYIQDTIQVFQILHNLCVELTSILAIQKQPTNRPQLEVMENTLQLYILKNNQRDLSGSS